MILSLYGLHDEYIQDICWNLSKKQFVFTDDVVLSVLYLNLKNYQIYLFQKKLSLM